LFAFLFLNNSMCGAWKIKISSGGFVHAGDMYYFLQNIAGRNYMGS